MCRPGRGADRLRGSIPYIITHVLHQNMRIVIFFLTTMCQLSDEGGAGEAESGKFAVVKSKILMDEIPKKVYDKSA